MTRLTAILLHTLLLLALSSTTEGIAASGEGKKRTILWVDSYHAGYAWSDGIEMGIRKVLEDTGIELAIFRMDTKTNDSTEYGITAGKKALEAIRNLKPDLVIATDDNAQKYLVVPYLRNTELPVVFSGVNWDASDYGYPAANVTGMLEIDRVDELIAHMQTNARGPRIGFLTVDVETGRTLARIINEQFLAGELTTYMVKTFAEFKESFLRAQHEVDMLIIYNTVGLHGWDEREAGNFIASKTTIPTGALLEFIKHLTVYTLGKSSEEHGEYAAETALQILEGKRPGDIPLTNSARVKLTVNLRMAKSAGIILPLSVLKTAEVIGTEAYAPFAATNTGSSSAFHGKKILWVDSYHEGYEWSDGIERGIREILSDTGVELRIVRLDTKRNTSPQFGRQAGENVLKAMQGFQPDVIIASDDNAQQYLVVPYLLHQDIPIIFCGVNWDASMYGYPVENVTGMIEVEPIEELVELMRGYANGSKIGYLCGDVATERKIVSIYQQHLFHDDLIPYYVDSMDEFKQNFLKAQEEVDLLIIPNHAGITDWDEDAAAEFIARHGRIPSGGVFDFMSRLVIFTLAKYPEEQGNYAATTALEILSGASPTSLPIRKNQRVRSTVNLRMADAAGIVIPVSLLSNVNTVIGQETFLHTNQ